MSSNACSGAAAGGHLDCLKYAHENGCPWDEDTCAWAAGNGHLDCLKYAHENGCPWDERTCQWAAMKGHLDCLKYAHENGCPDKCPYADAMAVLDENKEGIKDGNYKKIADALMLARREKIADALMLARRAERRGGVNR